MIDDQPESQFREALWITIRTHTTVDAATVTKACAVAWDSISAVIPRESITACLQSLPEQAGNDIEGIFDNWMARG